MKTIAELKTEVAELERKAAEKKARDAEASNPERLALEKRIAELEAELRPAGGSAGLGDWLDIYLKMQQRVPYEPHTTPYVAPHPVPQWAPPNYTWPTVWNGSGFVAPTTVC